MELREIRVGLVEPEVLPSFPGSHLSFFSVLGRQCCATFGGEISSELAVGDF